MRAANFSSCDSPRSPERLAGGTRAPRLQDRGISPSIRGLPNRRFAGLRPVHETRLRRALLSLLGELEKPG